MKTILSWVPIVAMIGFCIGFFQREPMSPLAKLRGSEPGYMTLELAERRQQATYALGYAITNLELRVRDCDVIVDHSNHWTIIRFQPK